MVEGDIQRAVENVVQGEVLVEGEETVLFDPLSFLNDDLKLSNRFSFILYYIYICMCVCVCIYIYISII